MESWEVIVVGAGIAGVSAVRALSAEGVQPVLLVNGETSTPYKRTKLSKNIASGAAMSEFMLETDAWYGERGITLRTDTTVASLDAATRTIVLSDGTEHSYKALVLATGSEPLYPQTVRPHEAGSYHVLRSADDLDGLRKAAKSAKRILVDGMGVLAVEVAAELNSMGKKVTLVGATPQLMPRHLNQRAGELLEELLTGKGIRLRFQEEILSFERREKGGFTVATIRESGNFDMVVFCIGVQPRTGIASDAGLEVGRGIVVNQFLQTSDPAIFAAGDCAEHDGGLVTDLWHAAEYQGELAGKNAASVSRGGGDLEAFENPAFRLKCEVFGQYFFSVGKPRDPLAYAIEEYEDGDRYRCFYFNEDRLAGVIMVNERDRAKEYQQAVRDGLAVEDVRSRFLD